MPSIFDSMQDTADSIRGIYNISRVRAEDDPEKRRALEDKLIMERREREKTKGMFEGAGDAVESRDADEGLDVRGGLDPKRALDRRMEEAEASLSPQERAAELQAKQQETRQIIQRRQAGEPISDDEKRLVFEVVYDAIKGLAMQREQRLDQMEATLQGQGQPPA